MPPPLAWNNTTGSPPLLEFDPGAYLLYVGGNPANGAFVTLGQSRRTIATVAQKAWSGRHHRTTTSSAATRVFSHFKHLKRGFPETKNALWWAFRYNDSVNAPSASGGSSISRTTMVNTIQLNITNISGARPASHQPLAASRTPLARGSCRSSCEQRPIWYSVNVLGREPPVRRRSLFTDKRICLGAFAGSALLALALPGYLSRHSMPRPRPFRPSSKYRWAL